MDSFTPKEKVLRLSAAMDALQMSNHQRIRITDAIDLQRVVLFNGGVRFILSRTNSKGEELGQFLTDENAPAMHDILQALMPQWFVVADNALNEWYLPKFRDALNAANVPFGFTALSERFMVWKTRGGYALLELFADAPIRLQWRVAVNFDDVEPQKRACVGMIAMAYRWGCIELQKDRPDLFDSPIDKEDKTNG